MAVGLPVLAEGELHRLHLDVADLGLHDRIVLPVDEVIVGSLVAKNPELGRHIILHLVVVAVHVVGRDVHDHGDVGLEVIHVLQLEAR